jgi:hypothetical protein
MPRTEEQEATFFQRPFRAQETNAPHGCGLSSILMLLPCWRIGLDWIMNNNLMISLKNALFEIPKPTMGFIE